MNKLIKQVGMSTIMMLAVFGTKMVFAGERGGNGGDAIFCEGKAPELLDSYEAREILGKEINLASDKPYSDLVSDNLEIILKKDIFRGEILKKYWKELKPELVLAENNIKNPVVKLTQDKLTEIPDEMRVSIPQYCEIKQLVNQLDDQRDAWNVDKPRYTIQKQIWTVLSEEQKAATILHELWYRYFMSVGETDSVNTRALNAIFLTDRYQELDFEGYYKMLNLTGANQGILYRGARFSFSTVFGLFSANNSLKKESVAFVEDKVFVVYPTDSKSNFREKISDTKDATYQSYVGYVALNATDGGVRYYLIRKFYDSVSKFNFRGVKINSSKGGHIAVDFWPNGELKTVYGKSVEKISFPNGLSFKRPQMNFSFDEKGQLLDNLDTALSKK